MGKIRKPVKEKKGLGYFLKNINKKHKISVRDQHNETEVWYMYISTFRITLAVVGMLLVMFVAVIATVVYTPILDTLPGYPGKKTREMLSDSILRLDSLEQELNHLRVYGENVTLILENKIPNIRTMRRPGETAGDKRIVAPSAEDSLYRWQVENDPRYMLSTEAPTQGNGRAREATFHAPVHGRVSSAFSPVTGMFGIGYEINVSQDVMAAGDGTVIMNTWTPEDGFVLQVQHKDNYISIYKGNTQSLKTVADLVERGEAIGYIDRENDHTGGRPGEFVFELWYDGRPVNPQLLLVAAE